MARKPPREDDPYEAQLLFFKEWMLEKKLIQKDVAERMQCGEGTLSKLISGKLRRTDYWMAKFAKAVDIDPWDIWKHPDTVAREKAAKDQNRRELIEEIRSIVDPPT